MHDRRFPRTRYSSVGQWSLAFNGCKAPSAAQARENRTEARSHKKIERKLLSIDRIEIGKHDYIIMLFDRTAILQGAFLGIPYVFLIIFVAVSQTSTSWTLFLNFRLHDRIQKEIDGVSKLCACSFLQLQDRFASRLTVFSSLLNNGQRYAFCARLSVLWLFILFCILSQCDVAYF